MATRANGVRRLLTFACGVLAPAACGVLVEDVSNSGRAPHERGGEHSPATPGGEDAGATTPDASLLPTPYYDGGSKPADGQVEEECYADDRGNWVCVWANPGWVYAAGPCAFTSEGQLWVNYRQPDGQNLLNQTVKMSPSGEVLHRRTESGKVGLSVNSLTAIDMLPTPDGGIVWVGQDSVDWPGGEAPAGGGYLDGLIVRLDSDGEQTDEWRYGGPGLQRIWDIAPAPDGGYYVIGESLFVRMSSEFEIIWDKADDEPLATNGGGLRIASNESGLLATSFAVRDADGNRLTTTATIGSGGDHLVLTEDGRLVNSAGFIFTLEDGILDESLPQQAQRLKTGRDTFVGTNRPRSVASEVSYEGDVLHSHDIPGSQSNWYNGGTCLAPDGSLAVSADSTEDSDFGILEAKVPSAGRSFVIYLVAFAAEP